MNNTIKITGNLGGEFYIFTKVADLMGLKEGEIVADSSRMSRILYENGEHYLEIERQKIKAKVLDEKIRKANLSQKAHSILSKRGVCLNISGHDFMISLKVDDEVVINNEDCLEITE